MSTELQQPNLIRLQALRQALDEGTRHKVHRQVNAMHPAEIASLLESLPPAQREVVWDLVDPELEGDVLEVAGVGNVAGTPAKPASPAAAAPAEVGSSSYFSRYV